MNRLHKTVDTNNSTQTGWRCLFVFCFALLLSACDGGLFGTGDGSESLDVTGSLASDQAPGTDTENQTDDGGMDDPGNENPGTSETTGDVTFNNTTPAGTSINLPGVKLINLSGVSLQIQLSRTQSDELMVPEVVQTSSTSSTLSLNNTDNRVLVQTSDTLESVLTINPLTTASDSLTTILVSSRPDTDNGPYSAFVFDTVAAEPNDGLIQIRVVSLIDNEATDTPISIVLEPGINNNTGAQLQISDNTVNDIFIGDYAANFEGQYTLRADNDAFTPVELELTGQQVYTVVISGDTHTPVYLENDTELP